MGAADARSIGRYQELQPEISQQTPACPIYGPLVERKLMFARKEEIC